MAEIRIAEADAADAAAWLALRDALWPGAADVHAAEIADRLATPGAGQGETLVLLAFAGDAAIGLAEAALRHDYVNGCDTSPVTFLEGLYVAGAWRRRGVARALVDRVAAWGRAHGCTEFASDADVDNAAGHHLHAALGFVETERVVYFRKALA